MADRNEVKALLARAGVEINNALKRVDHMSDTELDEVARIAPVAFFAENGSCGGNLESAQQKVLTRRGGIG